MALVVNIESLTSPSFTPVVYALEQAQDTPGEIPKTPETIECLRPLNVTDYISQFRDITQFSKALNTRLLALLRDGDFDVTHSEHFEDLHRTITEKYATGRKKNIRPIMPYQNDEPYQEDLAIGAGKAITEDLSAVIEQVNYMLVATDLSSRLIGGLTALACQYVPLAPENHKETLDFISSSLLAFGNRK